MKKTFVLTISFILTIQMWAQSYTPAPENIQARKEFQDGKFGMFIHWGVSSILADGEWVMNNRNIKVTDYQRLMNAYCPTFYDPAKWVATAKAAGMKYITFITRHHDGFSNWDTKESDWKISNTPYKKDVLKMLSNECHKQGIKLFLYYSLLDWYRFDYQYETGRTGKGTGRTKKSDWEHYIQFMKNQLTELLTNYGEIAGIWFDGHWDQLKDDIDKEAISNVNWHYDEIYKLIHSLQPQCLIANNHHLAPIQGEDFQAFEKDLPGGNTTGFGGANVSQLPLETCETMNNSWGFNITDRNYKSTKTLIQYLVKAAGLNANFLLNVGPMPDGSIQPEFVDTLEQIGTWMKKYGETIYGTRGAIIRPQEWGNITAKDNKFYVHILNKPKYSNDLTVILTNQKIVKATLLNDGKELKFSQKKDSISISVNDICWDNIDTIIELTIKK